MPRHLYLVRHGQMERSRPHPDRLENGLTPLLPLALAALACNLGGFFGSTTATPLPLPTALPTNLDPNYQPGGATAIAPTLPPSPTALPSLLPTLAALPEESIIILSPGPQSQVTSPLTVGGISDPTFENNLGVQILGEDGSVLATGFATLTGELGQRSPFVGMIEFTPPAQAQPGTLVVFDSSARDGHLVHLASVPITLLPAGSTAVLQFGSEHPEDIAIETPARFQTVSGGSLRVSGYSAPFFEQTLNVAVLNADGLVVGSSVLTLQAEAGQPGRFEGEVAYTVAGEQPGAVQVFATSPRDGSIVHLSSVEVTLRP